MSSLVRTIICCLSLSAASGVLAADSTPLAVQAPLPAAAEHSPPLLQRPHAGKLKHLDKRYAVPTVAHRRADGSLDIRSGGPLQAAAPQTEVHHDR